MVVYLYEKALTFIKYIIILNKIKEKSDNRLRPINVCEYASKFLMTY